MLGHALQHANRSVVGIDLVQLACHQQTMHDAKLPLSIIRDRYFDFGPTLACEKLRLVHGIVLA
jgi:hypothetical protein